MEPFPVPFLVAGAFVVGVIAGYGIRAFISARRRMRARRWRHDFDNPVLSVPRDSEHENEVTGLHRPGEPWTDADDKQLLQMVETGKSRVEIGRALKRTRGAVSSRLKVLRGTDKDRSKTAPDPKAFH
jgi:hypothetical protein